MECKFCKGNCQKAGKQKNGSQKYYCKTCKKYQQKSYSYQAYIPGVNSMISELLCESVGIRGIGRILKIAVNTVLHKIKAIAASISKPEVSKKPVAVEMDEMSVFIGSKENRYWIIYLLERETRKVLDFVVGNRSKKTIQYLLSILDHSMPGAIYTDHFPSYRAAISGHIHFPGKAVTNHIERMNLNLRTHLKRLGRKTICYSRSLRMLEACLIIYFFGR